MVMGRSAIAIMAFETVSLPALLACLNSRLLTALYRMLADEQGRVLPQVKVARMRALPIPTVAGVSFTTASASQTGRWWHHLHTLALRQLSLGHADPGVDTEIDEVVERLYGVTRSERTLLAGASTGPHETAGEVGW
jgi:hypothetical protein